MDEITCTTIHGFCYNLINPFPVESDLDPGASPMDESMAELLYQTVHDNWLREHFSTKSKNDDPLVDLILSDPDAGLKQIAGLSQFLRDHRDSKPVPSTLRDGDFAEFDRVVGEFRQWYQRQGSIEEDTANIIDVLRKIAKSIPSPRAKASFQALWEWAHPSLTPADFATVFKKDGEFRTYQKKGKWRSAAKVANSPPSIGDQLCAEAEQLYLEVREACNRLKAGIAQELITRFALAIKPLQDRYVKEKREAASLDFDDLLYKARDLLRSNSAVREALAKRYSYILVDEYQDTDPIQAEILFLLCGEGPPSGNWTKLKLRPGQLFIVGDPKQSIFRFRHADIRTYLKAQQSFQRQSSNNLVQIVDNFRSVQGILKYINERFEAPFSSGGQAGYAALSPVVEGSPHSFPPVAAIDIEYLVGDKPTQDEVRQAEAKAVTDLCSRLIGNLPVRENGKTVICRANHIALLAPTGTGLWYYERELERAGIPISTQAGKGFFQRQEVKDLIAVARVLTDSTDTLAFGALMRGPLVGLTEDEILEVVSGLKGNGDDIPKFWLWTEPEFVNHPVAHNTLRALQKLALRAQGTAPFDLMHAAVEDLRIRAILRQRHRLSAERVLSNVDLFLEKARPYGARGILAFARDMSTAWEDSEREIEGRSDPVQDALQVITVHSAKGLEWPVVIPINTLAEIKYERGILYAREDDTFHMRFGDMEPDSYSQVKEQEDAEINRERVRLWYVMCTRARDLLLIPRHENIDISKSWQSIVELGLGSLPAINVRKLAVSRGSAPHDKPNGQDRSTFEQEEMKVAKAHPKVVWIRPSSRDDHFPPDSSDLEYGSGVVGEHARPEVAGSALRGLVLHKLMEEVLTGILQEDELKLADRAKELVVQLGSLPSEDPKRGPCPKEMTKTVLNTLALPIVQENRSRILPEVNVHGLGNRETTSLNLISGVADALVVNDGGRVDLIIDWKSDVEPNAAVSKEHCAQLRQYLKATSCPSGAIVYMTLGRVDAVGTRDA
jgi:ATP-dependent helicase/nuclease subunit A